MQLEISKSICMLCLKPSFRKCKYLVNKYGLVY